ncbi:GHKL domain-containing protein [Anaerovorax odorimutans]|uniref:GHKL domain-containing protein n=1 Tax=Anaerovorax odorimutans TaxID=109327 RepID=A0ABT1RTE2_9FIRM|nr:GHKL domain-containing protein [Anaerovorax odorimutans]MCQ4638479.1 GHKL domain-containing protein [Anaerovorax odorimutans]
MEKQKKKLKIVSHYSELMANTNLKLKQNEHNFRGHLGALIAIVENGRSLDKVKEDAISYIEALKADYEKQVGGREYIIADNAFFAAYLSYVLLDIKEKSIEFNYTIARAISEYKFTQDELIVVLSNLINNAVDEVLKLPKDNRKIILLSDYDRFVLKNTVSPTFDVSTIPNFVETGFTTKNYGRGIGLNSVIETLKKKNMKLILDYHEGYFITEIHYII